MPLAVFLLSEGTRSPISAGHSQQRTGLWTGRWPAMRRQTSPFGTHNYRIDRQEEEKSR
jgi:hypothetical protein